MRWFVTQSLVPLEIQCVNFSQHYALTTYLFDTNALLFWMKMVTHCVEFNFEKYQKSAFVTSTPWGFFVICQRDWMANTKGNIDFKSLSLKIDTLGKHCISDCFFGRHNFQWKRNKKCSKAWSQSETVWKIYHF